MMALIYWKRDWKSVPDIWQKIEIEVMNVVLVNGNGRSEQ